MAPISFGIHGALHTRPKLPNPMGAPPVGQRYADSTLTPYKIRYIDVHISIKIRNLYINSELSIVAGPNDRSLLTSTCLFGCSWFGFFQWGQSYI